MKRTLYLTAIIALLIGFAACKQDTTCSLRVKVIKESNNQPLPGYWIVTGISPLAPVGPFTTSYDGSWVTNSVGIVEAQFALPAVIAVNLIDADAIDPLNATPIKTRIVKLEEGKTVTVEFVVP